MTTLPQAVLILDELAATYRVELDQGDPERWHRQIGKFHIDDVSAALATVQASPSQFMPTVGAFVDAIRQHVRRNGTTVTNEDCPFCGGTHWRQAEPLTDGAMVYDTVKVCEHCSPELLELAREKVAENRRTQKGKGMRDTLLPYRLGEKLNEARAHLRDITEPKPRDEDGPAAAGGTQ